MGNEKGKNSEPLMSSGHPAGVAIERAGGEVVYKVSAYLEQQLAIALRDHCYHFQLQISDVMEIALKDYLAKHKDQIQ